MCQLHIYIIYIYLTIGDKGLVVHLKDYSFQYRIQNIIPWHVWNYEYLNIA
jgi:hypothetical protein